jgi:putative peptidoglycan lipid II flippase
MIGETNRRIVRNLSIVVVFMFIAKLAGAAKEMAVAWRYGVGPLIDSFIFSSTVVSWAPMILTSILATIFVPLSAKLSVNDSENADLFFSELSGFIILVGLVMTFATAGLFYFPEIYPQSIAKDSQYLVLTLAPSAFFISLTGLIAARLIAQEKFANSLLDTIPALTLLASIVFVAGNRLALIWGSLIGAFLCCALSYAYAMYYNLIKVPRFSFTSPHWKTFWTGISLLTVGQLLMSIVALIDPYMLAKLGKGAIATLGYANRILALILTLGATAISRAILPVLSDKIACGEIAYARKLTLQWSLILLILALICCAIAWWLAPVSVQLLFERGAFTSTNTKEVSEVLRFGLLQVPFYFSAIVMVQFLAGSGRYGWIALGAALNLPVKYIANVVLGPLFGAGGIALATGVMYLGSMIFLSVTIYVSGRR